MTHKEQLIAMLDEAGIEWGNSGGDCIEADRVQFRFAIDGKLKEIESMQDDNDDDY